MRRRSSPRSYSRSVRNSWPSTVGEWNVAVCGETIRRRPGAPNGARSSCTLGYTVISSVPRSVQVRRASPNGSAIPSAAGPSEKRPRFVVGTRYAARARCCRSSAGMRKRAARRPPSNASVRVICGVLPGPGATTSRSTRASAPACTRLGCTARCTSSRGGRLRTQRNAATSNASAATPSTVSSSAPRSRAATTRPAAAPNRAQPRRVSPTADAIYTGPVAPGTGIASRISVRTSKGVRPRISASALRSRRWLSTAGARRFTSSGSV